MAHFAVLNESNEVEAINVIADSDCLDGDGNESEAVGIAFCVSLFGAGNYKQTSYNERIRKHYAEVGGKYDASADEFVRPQPFPSWTLDDNNDWQPPIAKPVGLGYWGWSEQAYIVDTATPKTEGWVINGITLQE
tara:strand:+ start:1011 stop:1415 length:405 start_codon:yes stop_codon:yes gene_type:complete